MMQVWIAELSGEYSRATCVHRSRQFFQCFKPNTQSTSLSSTFCYLADVVVLGLGSIESLGAKKNRHHWQHIGNIGHLVGTSATVFRESGRIRT
jgi:hypothetical protein